MSFQCCFNCQREEAKSTRVLCRMRMNNKSKYTDSIQRKNNGGQFLPRIKRDKHQSKEYLFGFVS